MMCYRTTETVFYKLKPAHQIKLSNSQPSVQFITAKLDHAIMGENNFKRFLFLDKTTALTQSIFKSP